MKTQRKPFYVDRSSWSVQEKDAQLELQDVFELPEAVVRMDVRAKTHLCKLLESPKSKRLRDVFKASMREAGDDSREIGLGWGLHFRAIYMSAWCHDLAWFAVTPSSAPELVKVRTPFKRTCHVCGNGGFGYRRPTDGFGKKSDGDLLAHVPLPSRLKQSVVGAREEIRRLRANGDFDVLMKEVAQGVRRLRRSINAYVILPVFQFDARGERVAISNAAWLAPGAMPDTAAIEAGKSEKYFSPCSWCRGSGSEY